MRMIRGLAGVVAAVGVAVALAPAPAYAKDDVTCVREDTRQTTIHTDEGYNTIVVGYCAEYRWNPPVAGSSDPKDQPGGGGGKEVPECEELNDAIEAMGDQIDLLNSEIDAATRAADVLGREAQAARERNSESLTRWIDGQREAQRLLAEYIRTNDIEPIEITSYGHTTYRAITVADVDPTRPGGTAAIDADHEAKQLGREHTDTQDEWLELQHRADQTSASLYDLQARLRAAIEAIRSLQAIASHCR
ncbi:hypothetical protein KOI35_08995 [Actinoplanes bogorensis]|uniref:Secreted protein n=1 Tax=Paractinoplanes bogorensis TaxID=1610840 RepID=A0ABS5YJI7_9ACTN|nr:hypothetical protein [Actinoplanes bogorensis]MBU2663641.1 hypothetical protein [Actinoplanes bogorensis]